MKQDTPPQTRPDMGRVGEVVHVCRFSCGWGEHWLESIIGTSSSTITGILAGSDSPTDPLDLDIKLGQFPAYRPPPPRTLQTVAVSPPCYLAFSLSCILAALNSRFAGSLRACPQAVDFSINAARCGTQHAHKQLAPLGRECCRPSH